ncbi:Protein of unknown function [Gryllus bimaculatus]|nr:Protein of unknown function [Gryllus bimaculatus]
MNQMIKDSSLQFSHFFDVLSCALNNSKNLDFVYIDNKCYSEGNLFTLHIYQKNKTSIVYVALAQLDVLSLALFQSVLIRHRMSRVLNILWCEVINLHYVKEWELTVCTNLIGLL